MVDIEATLRPLVDHPASAPRPVAEIAARARRRRLRRRSAALAVTVAALATVGAQVSLDSSANTTTADRPAEHLAPTTAAPPSTAAPTSAPTTAAPTTAPPTTAPLATVTTPPAAPSTTTPPVPMGPVDPFGLIEAEAHDDERGVATAARPGGGFEIRGLADGDHVVFHDVDFGTALATRFEAHVASGAGPGVEGTIEVRLDDVASPPFATITVTDTGSWSAFDTLTGDTPAIGGTHDIYVTFSSPHPTDFAAVDWFRFGE